MAIALVLLYIFLLIPASVIWSGYTLSVLWGWFMVPALGVPSISIPAAIGVTLVATFITYQIDAAKKDDREFAERVIENTTVAALRPAVYLLFGWIVLQWM